MLGLCQNTLLWNMGAECQFENRFHVSRISDYYLEDRRVIVRVPATRARRERAGKKAGGSNAHEKMISYNAKPSTDCELTCEVLSS